MFRNRILIGFLIAMVGGILSCSKKKETPQTQQTSSPPAAAASCNYEADAKDILLEWTGYKTNQKVAASGKFNNFIVNGLRSAPTLTDLMRGQSVSIDASAISTGNPARDVTLQEFFFGKLNPPFQISAAIDRVEGDDAKGTIEVKATMNGKSQVIPLSYTGDPQTGTIEAKGSLDILQFGAQAAYDSIHQACESLHTGTDGVSKTWTTVDLKLTGKYRKICR